MKALHLFFCLTIIGSAVSAQDTDQSNGTKKQQKQFGKLLFPKNFEPAKYLGKWYEIARMPTFVQPKDSSATAEYSKGDKENEIVVKNTAYFPDGKPMLAITGKAVIEEGDPPRLSVSFGPIVPNKPNYYVLYVDEKYETAVVGTPDRKSLWILARKAPISKDRLEELVALAKKAEFETDKLV